MSTNHRTTENASENSFRPIEPPRRITPADLADCCDDAAAGPAADETRFYAVARQNGVEHYGPGALQQRDACRVLYLDADAERALELHVRTIEGRWSEIDATVDVPADADRIDTPSDGVAERYAPVLAHHGVAE